MKHKMKFLVLGCVALIGLASLAYADYQWVGIKVTCSEAEYKIEEHRLYNEDPQSMVVEIDKNTKIYYDKGEHDISCQLQKHNIKASFIKTPGGATGICATVPHFSLTLNMNEVNILDKHLFAYGCISALHSVSILEQFIKPSTKTESQEKALPWQNRTGYTELEFCGSGAYMQNGGSKSTACMDYSWHWLKNRKLPLDFKNKFYPYIPDANDKKLQKKK